MGNNDDIDSVKLDSISYPGKVSLIKMDIEGAEIDALKGARNLIKNNNPKLAICVYHRLEDLWNVPLSIMSISSDYTYYLRHHSPVIWDSVCYAVPNII